MTLETLITFLKIENNNMNNHIVTFAYRVMVTAFAILAMFSFIKTGQVLDSALLVYIRPIYTFFGSHKIVHTNFHEEAVGQLHLVVSG